MKTEKKESFKFSYTEPCMDWYKTIDVEIKPDDYICFKLKRRYHPFWFLVGSKPSKEDDLKWEDTELGWIGYPSLRDFIEWAKLEHGGSRIVEISAISGSLNILEEVKNLIERKMV